MAEPALSLRMVKVPRWMTTGIDLDPYIGNALDSIGNTLHKRQGRGLGAKRNDVTLSSVLGARRIESSRNYPRTTGSSWTRNAEGRFRGQAPRAVKKYIVTPLEQEWAA